MADLSNPRAFVALAKYESESAASLRGKLQDKHSQASSWIVASLFAVNGAGLLHILSKHENFSLAVAVSALCFLFGLFFCFLTVILEQVSDRFMIPAMHSWGLYWTGVSEHSERDNSEEAMLRGRIEQASRIARFSRVALIFAAIDFMIGVSLAALPALAFLT